MEDFFILLYSTLIAYLLFLLGVQIYAKDFLLLSGIYHYRIRLPQAITYIAAFFSIYYLKKATIIESSFFDWISFLTFSITAYIGCFIFEWILAKLNWKSKICTAVARLVGIAILVSIQWAYHETIYILPFIIAGFYMRNCKFGVVHGKEYFLASHLRPRTTTFHYSHENTNETTDIPQFIPDFSNAGLKQNFGSNFKKFNICDFGIKINSNKDQSIAIQKAIDTIGKDGGGIIFFPKGKYKFNNFIQINHSNLILEGEINDHGESLAEFILCKSLAFGKRNPWLSPFLITTGEKIQQSNIFFGLQFRKRKDTFTQSISLSDPGSNGNILTPKFACKVINSSQKGERILHVEDSSKLSKFIMLGLYNTTDDGNLLKDILGIDDFRPEWQTALRAGEEQAPSYQWLAEIKNILDAHTVELTQPLWRNCDMIYEPEIFNVPMLENVGFRNLKLSSTWNGLFRHHGYRRYYSVAQTQEMDYGWNGINMKRIANGFIENVSFKNFTNPLYVMDSRNISATHLDFSGYDGHQGIKIYEHACDNLFQGIIFQNHFADMMGGEGNAYGNVFSNVQYVNPIFKPVDYDFHGFSEGPMSPPSHNLFELVSGFSLIHCGGSNHMHPSFAQHNVWWNCYSEGEMKNAFIFRTRYNKKKFTPQEQCKIFNHSIFCGIHGKFNTNYLSNEYIFYKSWNKAMIPNSLYRKQKIDRRKIF